MNKATQYLQSVLAALFGVQSAHKREQDFKTLSFKHLVVIGLVMTALLVLAISGVVLIILP